MTYHTLITRYKTKGYVPLNIEDRALELHRINDWLLTHYGEYVTIQIMNLDFKNGSYLKYWALIYRWYDDVLSGTVTYTTNRYFSDPNQALFDGLRKSIPGYYDSKRKTPITFKHIE